MDLQSSALRAIIFAVLILQACTNPCAAQTSPAVRKPSRPNSSNVIGRSLTQASRAHQQNAARTSVRQASAIQHGPTLAPAASQGAHESISVMDSAEYDLAHEGHFASNAHFADNAAYGSCDGCDSCGGIDSCCCAPGGFLFDWTRADVWAGTVGYTVPSNILSSANNSTGAVEGSFGFQEGFNFGTRLPSLLCGQVGSQLGARFIQSQLNGSAAGVDNRNQAFVTGGLFRRVDYGFQGGLVVDYLHDDWIYKADLLQLRGELSFLLSPCHELGFRFTDSQQTDATSYQVPGASAATEIQLTTLNTYRGFYRFRFSEQARGQAELQAGWTEDSGAILGLSLLTPLQSQVGLATNANYLIPQRDAAPEFAFEGWNISLAIVWTPGRPFGLARDYYRPLFEVADNGSMISKFE